MAIPFITPNMGLTEPAIGVTLSPGWAMILNADMGILDGHNHAPGSGVPITPAGLNISSDLSFLLNNATNLRTTRFTPISLGSLTGADTDCVLVSGVDFYVVDGNGNVIRLTQSGGIAGTPGSISGLVSPASATYVALTDTFVWESNSGVAANMDAATYILRYPSTGYPSPAGNYIALQAPSTLSTGFAITFPAVLPSTNSFVTMDSTGQLSVSMPTTPNQTISASSGTFVSLSTFPTTVPGVSTTITTMGNPVELQLIPDGGSLAAGIGMNGSGSGVFTITIGLYRDGSLITVTRFDSYSSGGETVYMPPGGITTIDTPSAGSHTYTIKVAIVDGSEVLVSYCKLAATELI